MIMCSLLYHPLVSKYVWSITFQIRLKAISDRSEHDLDEAKFRKLCCGHASLQTKMTKLELRAELRRTYAEVVIELSFERLCLSCNFAYFTTSCVLLRTPASEWDPFRDSESAVLRASQPSA